MSKKRFKKGLALLMSALMAFSVCSAAIVSAGAVENPTVSSGETFGNYEYALLEDGTVEITGYTGSDTAPAIPSKINGKSVTSIGESAFKFCSGLQTITIPNSVTSIGDYAFFSCTGLTSVEIPNSVTSIGISAFCFCKGLTNITIPDSVTSIDHSTFSACTRLTDINVSENNPKYSSVDGAVLNKSKTELILCPVGKSEYTIPVSVTSIADHAFSGCTVLKSITIPNRVTSIGIWAFFACTGLESITIGNRVTSIGWNAFSECTSLTSVIIPDSVTSIGMSAFAECTSLTSVTIPNSITSIESETFYNCTSLKSVKIPNSVTSIGWHAFGHYEDTFGDNTIAGFTIYGYAGSAAETYAIDNDFNFVALATEQTLGDVTGDSKISVADAIMIQKHIANIITLEGDSFTAADVDKNGKISVADAIMVQKHIANIISIA